MIKLKSTHVLDPHYIEFTLYFYLVMIVFEVGIQQNK